MTGIPPIHVYINGIKNTLVFKRKDGYKLELKAPEAMILFYSARKKRRNIEGIKKIIIKMEHYKISKLLNDSIVLKFVTKNWMELNGLSSSQHSVHKNIRFKSSMLTSDVCGYSNVYIFAKDAIDILADNAN